MLNKSNSSLAQNTIYERSAENALVAKAQTSKQRNANMIHEFSAKMLGTRPLSIKRKGDTAPCSRPTTLLHAAQYAVEERTADRPIFLGFITRLRFIIEGNLN